MVREPFAPCEAEAMIFGPSNNRGVFAGNIALVVVAIEGPRLQLAARQSAFVHQQVEGMPVVIAFFADGMEAGDKIGFREKWFVVGAGHKLNSIPS
jgi:hypothetical protein